MYTLKYQELLGTVIIKLTQIAQVPIIRELQFSGDTTQQSKNDQSLDILLLTTISSQSGKYGILKWLWLYKVKPKFQMPYFQIFKNYRPILKC